MKKTAILCWVSVVLVSVGSVACTRAKPESLTEAIVASTPTLGAAVETPEPTTPAPASTAEATPAAPPTETSQTSEPTVISVAQESPTLPPSTITPLTPTPSAGPVEYTVQWGDTLFSLARRYDTSVDAIVALNSLPNASSISVGQVLSIPGASGVTPVPGGEYIVQPGDTLFSIAQRHNTTVAAIQHANGIVNPWLIRVGQRLIIPQGTTPPPPGGNTYVVQPGDTLYSIAARFGKNVWDIVVANNLSNPNLIQVGQVLTIPS